MLLATNSTSRSGSVRALIGASHFPPTFAVTTFTTVLAISSGRGWTSVAVAAAVLCGQLTVGWSNDFIDRERDRLSGRTDKPIPAGRISAQAVRNAAIVAAAVCVPLSMLSGWRAGCVHIVAVAAALSYNLGLKRTAFSVLPYIVAFGLLPVFVSLGRRGHPAPPSWTIVAAALLGGGAHFLNTLPDLDDDARTGVHGLPHRFGAAGSVVVGAALLSASVLTVSIAPAQPLSGVGLILTISSMSVVAAVIAAAATGRARLAWHLSLAAATVTVALYLVRNRAGW